ncbi:protease, Abi superfamily, putative [Citrifermentans bemidjiense Bem]|uniref:Protease, Abi superfamily, putative n=1 Tax=Citrifermentans bemidjiense (strain ATCC BAA-1014 / DSM 16622 / JCM 12645 / Bem) TaxID=404380 RepID=B5EA75_CITBB|nr:CAAX prenyl protease-related protein [Citrifermentans bemidjiense]ACH38781.1 protease, Abi superfamily, putative [Citrifermentans bemidjiense Bem]
MTDPVYFPWLNMAIYRRTVPFAMFMAFVALEETFRYAIQQHWLDQPITALYYLYPIKTVAVALLLYKQSPFYHEIRIQDLGQLWRTVSVALIGLLTFAIWVSADWVVTLASPLSGFNPMLLPDEVVRVLMTAFRVVGAVLVVPIMEEVFWRSFLLRYLVDTDFESIPIGSFTWSSFLISTVLFGLEHHLIVAGMIASVFYSLIVYKTKSIAQCILAHAITNFALACFVLFTGKWHFW